jgi:hypothetical protein
MNAPLFIAGGLALLLLFGCVGGQKVAIPEKTAPPPKLPVQPAGSIGDKDFSGGSEEEEDVLVEEDILPPPDVPETGSKILVEVDDIFVEEVDDSNPIGEEDIIAPN